MKKKIARWYKYKIWTLQMVKDAVKMKAITSTEYKEITGEEYIEE